MTRPTSITVIAWLFIVTSVISVAVNYHNLSNPLVLAMMDKSLLSVTAQFALLFGGLVITFVSGVGLLKGFNWGRTLYIGWTLIGSVITVITSPMKIMVIPGLIVLAIIAFFLYRPQANAWFARPPVAANEA